MGILYIGTYETTDRRLIEIQRRRSSNGGWPMIKVNKGPHDDSHYVSRRQKKFKSQHKRSAPLHFHVTYWMFYPFSEGKTVCELDLGFFGSWPIPSISGICFGRLKEYGSHVGDWEHVSLYFKVRSNHFFKIIRTY